MARGANLRLRLCTAGWQRLGGHCLEMKSYGRRECRKCELLADTRRQQSPSRNGSLLTVDTPDLLPSLVPSVRNPGRLDEAHSTDNIAVIVLLARLRVDRRALLVGPTSPPLDDLDQVGRHLSLRHNEDRVADKYRRIHATCLIVHLDSFLYSGLPWVLYLLHLSTVFAMLYGFLPSDVIRRLLGCWIETAPIAACMVIILPGRAILSLSLLPNSARFHLYLRTS
ncbi:hypothetical protein B0H10DRAFT_1989515 [Mycena sp. CBHHK59/15]|nr:hypothetical protein B0H10DRAFT_1989515 [Mycena sp. CBHHK59/15]